MQGYVPAPDGAFAQSRECYAELEEWLASNAAGLQHGELEEQLDVRGRELLRRLYQDRLDLTAAREVRRHDVTGEDGIPRVRAEKGRTRPLVTKFGQVTVSRIAYRVPGRPNVHPLDAELNLPEEKHSHGLRKLAAIESARGSIEAAGAAVARATGVKIGKRQLEELARRCAAHVEAFYMFRVISPVPDNWPLVLTFDGKGIVMLPGALRPATAKAAAAAEGKLATRLSPGEKNGRKRMAELACVYDAAPVPRTPEDIISTPAQKRKKKEAQAGKSKTKGKGKPREPQARGKWLTASVTDDIPAVIAAAFDEAERRDPQNKRERAVLIDGNNTQIEAVTAEAGRRSVTVTIVIDLIHVTSTCGRPRTASSTPVTPPPAPGSKTRRPRSSPASTATCAPGSAAAPPPTATPQLNVPAPTNARTTSSTSRTTWTTPPSSPPDGPWPAVSSRARHAGSSRTDWKSPAPDGAWTAPKPSSSSAPCTAPATSATTSTTTSSRKNTATTTAVPAGSGTRRMTARNITR